MIANRSLVGTQDKLAVLNCRRLPARLNTSEAAVVLGFQDHDIPVLIAARLLTPLGKPAPNAPKYFAAREIVLLAENPQWLSTATKTIAGRWFEKNQRKGGVPGRA